MSSTTLTVEEVTAWAKDAKAITQLNGQFYAKDLRQHRHFSALCMVARAQGLITTEGHRNKWARGDINEPVAWVLLKGLRTYVDDKTAKRDRPKANGDTEPQMPLDEPITNNKSRLDRIEERLDALEGRLVDGFEVDRVDDLESTVKLLDNSVKEILSDLV